jgi:uncharacterized membrane protein YhhN
MTLGRVLVAVALLVAAGDWIAVATGRKPAEYVLKPLTLALMIAAAVALRPGVPGPRFAFTVAALVLSLAGDVFLMVPADLFVPGLAAFLLAHLAYVGAFNQSAPPALPTVPAAVVVAGVAAALFLPMRAGMVRTARAKLAIPVAAYVLAIGAMVVSAIATAGRAGWSAGSSALAIAGAGLFFCSDALIGWSRFVRPIAWSPAAIIVSYHLGQAALVLALLH